VRALEKAGLYRYLQEDAAALLKKDAAFSLAYYKSLARLGGMNDRDKAADEQAVAALIRDYLDTACDWPALKKGGWEEYKTVFARARQFILPMNPPRVALEKAIRLVFAEHGVELKKIRPPEKSGQADRRRRRPAGRGKPAKPAT